MVFNIYENILMLFLIKGLNAFLEINNLMN